MRKLKTIFLFMAIASFNLYAAKGPVIPSALNIYISEKGQDYFANNLQQIIESNGFLTDYYFLSKKKIETKEALLEDLISNPEMRETIVKVKEAFKKYLLGLNFEKHKFSINVDNIEAQVDWEDFGLFFQRPLTGELDRHKSGVRLKIVAQTRDIQVAVNRASVKDLNHAFLGEVALNQIFIGFDQESEPLRVEFPVRIYKDEKGVFKAQVENPFSNLDKVGFDVGYKSPIELPEIEIRINDHVVKPNLKEIESLILENTPKVIKSAQKEGQAFLSEKAAPLLAKALNDIFVKGLMEENVMDAPGAPVNSRDAKLKWGLNVTNLGYAGDAIKISLGAYVNDPTARVNVPFPRGLRATKSPATTLKEIEENDITVLLNEGLFNRIVQLSTNRGYFKSLEISEGKTIQIKGQPILRLKGAAPHGRVKVTIIQKVKGLQALVIKGDLKITFDLLIGFTIKDGKLNLIAKGIDMNSVSVPRKNVARLVYKKVIKDVKKEIGKIQRGIINTALIEDIPIPTSFGGIEMEMKKVKIDKSGFIAIFMEIVKD